MGVSAGFVAVVNIAFPKISFIFLGRGVAPAVLASRCFSLQQKSSKLISK